MKIRVYGKINLSLNVLTKEIDGYHQLDMVNQSVSVFDEIELAPRVDKLCRVRCDKDIGVINTALTSASAFVKRFGTNGYDIFIKKGIPMKGGLGGSSADAAGTKFMQSTISALLEAVMSATAVYVTGHIFLRLLEREGERINLQNLIRLRREGRLAIGKDILLKVPAEVVKRAAGRVISSALFLDPGN